MFRRRQEAAAAAAVAQLRPQQPQQVIQAQQPQQILAQQQPQQPLTIVSSGGMVVAGATLRPGGATAGGMVTVAQAGAAGAAPGTAVHTAGTLLTRPRECSLFSTHLLVLEFSLDVFVVSYCTSKCPGVSTFLNDSFSPASRGLSPLTARPLEPMFHTVPPRPQRLLHSEAYIRYIEGLTADSQTMSNWEKQLNASQDNTKTDEARLPAHWLANNGKNQ